MVWRNWPNSKLICYSERGEPRLSFEYKFVGHFWKLLKFYLSVHSYFFSPHCIVLFPLRAPASWRSAKCTRRLFNLNMKFKIDVILKEENLGFFEYEFEILKLYPSVHSYIICFLKTPHCIVLFPLRAPASWRSAKCNGGSLRYEGIGQIQNWCVILKEENLGFHLNINLSAIFEKFSNYTQVYIHINFFLHTVLYCFHWEHQQVEGVQSADGGSLWYEGIGQIQNWCVILKEENLGFHLNIYLSAIFENFSN